MSKASEVLYRRLTAKLLLRVVEPVPAPNVTVVASPPILSVVAVVLNTVAVVLVVVISPPLTAMSAPAVTFPVRREVPSIVRLPFACMFPVAPIVTPVDPYPPPTFKILNEAVAEVPFMAGAFGKFITVPCNATVADVAPIVLFVVAPTKF